MALAFWNGVQTVNTTTEFNQADPSIVRLADGNVLVVWSDQATGNSDIKFQRYDAIGNKIGIETLAQLPSSFNQNFSDVAALSTGLHAAPWRCCRSARRPAGSSYPLV